MPLCNTASGTASLCCITVSLGQLVKHYIATPSPDPLINLVPSGSQFIKNDVFPSVR